LDIKGDGVEVVVDLDAAGAEGEGEQPPGNAHQRGEAKPSEEGAGDHRARLEIVARARALAFAVVDHVGSFAPAARSASS
jgi:hypothetical protein